MGFFLDPAMLPFMVSLCVLIFLVGLEILLLVLGADLFNFVDDLIPDIGEADAPEALSVSKALAFIGVGKVPVLMVLMAFLATFGLSGYILQKSAVTLAGGLLPLAAAVPLALVLAVLCTGRVAAGLARVLPSEETSAVSAESLIGRTAAVSYGDATFTRPAAAKVADQHGNVHHIQVKASAPEELLHQGQEILLVSRASGFFIGTHVPVTNV